MPLLSISTALLVGAIVMLLSGDNPLAAYWGLLRGAVGNLSALSQTIRKATPFILTGLSVAFAFKAGLFNIGASGQFLMGTIFSVAVGISFPGLPMVIHMPLALLAGILGGALWGAIAGWLKVWKGAHEVITTIMLNYIASLFASWTVYAGGTAGQKPGPLSDPEAAARAISETRDVFESARIPQLFPGIFDRVHWGIILALMVALLVWWVLWKTTLGFEIRTVGQNAHAAHYAGIRVGRTMALSMAIAGGLAGLAGAVETLGLNYKFAPEFTGGVGFEGITIALLGQTHPFGVVLSSFLIGGLNAGSAKMQFDSGVAKEIIQVVQALVLAFVAAPEIIRSLYRLRKPTPEEILQQATAASSWSQE
ncbi:MAG TPA: ABC transporter permease [Anaerolineales bacterium]|nr:ABC transporter permease [Anaerolineales bacterium]